MRRFRILAILGLASYFSLATARFLVIDASAVEVGANRPNVVLIYADDWRWDCLGVVQREQGEKGRFPWLETPRMDELAAEGIRFRQSFVVNSLCSPGRACVLTGRYSHANEIIGNSQPMPLDAVTVATRLRDAGYSTAYCGKYHMDAQRERPGFGYIASFIGQGRYNDCPILFTGPHDSGRTGFAVPARVETKGWIDDVSTDYAIEFLERQKAGKPFFLFLGFKSPHGPRGGENLPERVRGLYADAESRPVPSLALRPIFEETNGRPANRHPRREQRQAEGHRAYMRHITAIDDCVGRVLDALDRTGNMENTIVIVTSDNGFYLGEHGLSDKRSAYEESIRVPLLVRFPGNAASRGVTNDAMVLNIDYAPTILDFAGAEAVPNCHGRSLRPVLEGEAPADWRNAFLYEYFKEPQYASPTVLAVRTTSHKLITYPGHDEWNEVFDLQNDPYETKNLADDVELLENLEGIFAEQTKAVAFRMPNLEVKANKKAAKKGAKKENSPTRTKVDPMRIAIGLFALLALATLGSAADRLNVLIITVDDMSADSLGAFGCKLAETSPNIDRLAAESMRFNFAHVQVANCMPSRNVLYSGLYPHNNRVEGFYQVRNPGYPVLADLMKGAGYFTAIRGKVGHSTPYAPYAWDLVLDRLPNGKKAAVKDIASYRTSTEHGIRAAKEAGKPFCLLINVSDPHKPFYAEGRRGMTVDDPHVPSRVFKPREVPVPGFLFDDPVVRKEIAHYYSSVRRADDCVGGILKALDESGEADRTVVLFLSDHGMPLPFAKTQVYHHSTHTPLVIRWPGITKPGSVDRQHMVSAVDFLPTLLDIVGIEHPEKLDGRSFEPLLRGEVQDDRDMIVKEYNENSGGNRSPMRAVQSRRYLYIFSPWSNGKRIMATATKGTSTYRRMRELAKADSTIARRLDLFDHRVVEELYDVEKDPDCLTNLIVEPAHATDLAELRQSLEAWMVETADPMLAVFRERDSAAAREAYMAGVEKEAAQRGPKAKKERKALRRRAKLDANGRR